MKLYISDLNIKKRCSDLGVPLTSCPPFLFIVMGVVVIVATLATYRVAQLYTEPNMAALIVLALAGFLVTVSYLIVNSFEQLVAARKKEHEKTHELLKLKDEFVFLAAHELRAPATAIKWALELLESDKPQVLQEDPESFRVIAKNSERLVNLVHDLLETSRIESRTLRLKKRPISLHAFIEKAIKNFSAEVNRKKIKIKNNIQEDVVPVLADRDKFMEVVENLLSNAIKSSKDGGVVEISTDDENAPGAAAGFITVSFKDKGRGIKKEEAPHIFEKFWQAEYSSDTENHTGLGLFITKHLVEIMGGSINFESEYGKGTTFFVKLPTARQEVN